MQKIKELLLNPHIWEAIIGGIIVLIIGYLVPEFYNSFKQYLYIVLIIAILLILYTVIMYFVFTKTERSLGIKKLYKRDDKSIKEILKEPKETYEWFGLSAILEVVPNQDTIREKGNVNYKYNVLDENSKINVYECGQRQQTNSLSIHTNITTTKDTIHNLALPTLKCYSHEVIPSFRLAFLDNNKLYLGYYPQRCRGGESPVIEITKGETEFNLYSWFRYYFETIKKEMSKRRVEKEILKYAMGDLNNSPSAVQLRERLEKDSPQMVQQYYDNYNSYDLDTFVSDILEEYNFALYYTTNQKREQNYQEREQHCQKQEQNCQEREQHCQKQEQNCQEREQHCQKQEQNCQERELRCQEQEREERAADQKLKRLGITGLYDRDQKPVEGILKEAKILYEWFGLSAVNEVYHTPYQDIIKDKENVHYDFYLLNDKSEIYIQEVGRREEGKRTPHDIKTNIANVKERIKMIQKNQKYLHSYSHEIIPSLRVVFVDDKKLYLGYYPQSSCGYNSPIIEITREESAYNLYSWFRYYFETMKKEIIKRDVEKEILKYRMNEKMSSMNIEELYRELDKNASHLVKQYKDNFKYYLKDFISDIINEYKYEEKEEATSSKLL